MTSNSCDSFIVLTLSVLDTVRTEMTDTICTGMTHYFNNQYLTDAGIYRDTLATVNACDSFIVLDLKVLPIGDSCDDGNPNTTNDTLDINCTCVGDGFDPNSCHVSVTLSGDTIKVENMIQSIIQLDIYTENWLEVVYTCGYYDCNVDEAITGLPVGVYHVKVQAWTAGWAQMVCDLIVDVEIVGVPNSTTCDVIVEVNEDTIKVNNLTQPITRLDIFNEEYTETVYSCGNEDCNIDEVIPDLANGIYHVKVQSWTAANFEEGICDTIIDVEIGMMPPSVCDVEIITGNDFITVNNLDEPLVSMFIFSGDYHTTLFHCDYGDCPTSKTITGLQPGAYVVKVQTYTANFNEEVCNFLQTVIVGSNNCFSDNMTHFFGILETGMYQAENAIMSSGQVMEDTVVTFAATNSITLSAGFQASAGSSFTAMIDNCSNTILEPIANSRTSVRVSIADKFLKIAPNPFKNNTRIHYQLPNQIQNISLYVYDMTGQIIKIPIQEQAQTKGLYVVDLQAYHLLSGMYYVALRIDGEVLIEKIVVMN